MFAFLLSVKEHQMFLLQWPYKTGVLLHYPIEPVSFTTVYSYVSGNIFISLYVFCH